MGGSIALVRWLVETHLCPVSVTRNTKGQLLSVQTSARRTLLDIAMTGRPKMEILAYLVGRGLSIYDVKDPTLAPKTLEVMLKGHNAGMMVTGHNTISPAHGVAMIGNDDDEQHNIMMDTSGFDESVTTTEDHCALCCERSMDCVLIPCGHQICCTECGHQIKCCPVCKVNCSVLRIFRQ